MASTSERSVRPAFEPVDIRLGQNLRRLRHERGLILDAVSDRSLVSRAMSSKIERGVAVPTAAILGK